MMDSRGRLFGKVSVVDVVILVVVVAAAFSFYLRTTGFGKSADIRSDTVIQVTFKVPAVRDLSVAAVEKGSVFYERGGPRLGVVSETSTKQAHDIIHKVDGEAVYGEMEQRYDLFITLECMGRADELGYFVNGTRQVAVGSEISIKSNAMQCNAVVYSVEAAQ